MTTCWTLVLLYLPGYLWLTMNAFWRNYFRVGVAWQGLGGVAMDSLGIRNRPPLDGLWQWQTSISSQRCAVGLVQDEHRLRKSNVWGVYGSAAVTGPLGLCLGIKMTIAGRLIIFMVLQLETGVFSSLSWASLRSYLRWRIILDYSPVLTSFL